MFYSYPESEQPKICPIKYFHITLHSIVLVINALVPCSYLSTILLQKESCAMKKRERKKRVLKKNGQVFKILKQWVLRCPPRKKREKKIAHDL
jgi:hypothetical protein